MHSNCQVCGNPMFGYKDMGLNKDGSINKDFCTSCYRFGKFTRDMDHNHLGFTSTLIPITANSYGTGAMGMGMPLGNSMELLDPVNNNNNNNKDKSYE